MARDPAERQRVGVGHQKALAHEHLHGLRRIHVRSVVQRVPFIFGQFDPEPRELMKRRGVATGLVEYRLHGVERASDGQKFAREQRVFATAANVHALHGHEIVLRHGVRSGGRVAPAQLKRARRRLEQIHHVGAELRLELLRHVWTSEFLSLRFLGVAGGAHQTYVLRAAAVCHWRFVMNLPAPERVEALGASPVLHVHERLLVGFAYGLALAHQEFVHELVPHDCCGLPHVVELKAQLVLHALAKSS